MTQGWAWPPIQSEPRTPVRILGRDTERTEAWTDGGCLLHGGTQSGSSSLHQASHALGHVSQRIPSVKVGFVAFVIEEVHLITILHRWTTIFCFI